MAVGRFRHAIDDYTACGRILTTFNVVNSAVVSWRSKAAFGALAVQRYDLALALAEDELIAARKWGSARGMGIALHAVAMARRDETSTGLLEEAVQLLDLGRARTELMQALYDLGSMQVERKDVAGGRSSARARARWRANAATPSGRNGSGLPWSAWATPTAAVRSPRRSSRSLSWPVPDTATGG